MIFHQSEHVLENSEELTEASGCFLLCSSQQVCTKNVYDDILPLSFLRSPLPIYSYFSSARLRVTQFLSGSHLPRCCLCGAQCTAVVVLIKLLMCFQDPSQTLPFHKALFSTTAAPLLLKHVFCAFVHVLPISWDALFTSSVSQDPIHIHLSKMDSDVICHLLIEPSSTRHDKLVIPSFVLSSHYSV